METVTKIKTGPKDLKQKRDSPPRRSLREILQQGAGSSGAPSRRPVATSKPAVEISAKDSLGVSSTDIPLQEASTLLLLVGWD
jgi:hypothetical protein